jgi:hypothetical protein
MSATRPCRFLTADRDLLAIASRLQMGAGLVPHGRGRWLEHPNDGRARAVASSYDALTHDPHNREVAVAYEALCNGIHAQFEALLDAGYTFLPWTSAGQPYPNSAAMRADVIDRKRLAFFLGGDFLPGHPLAADSGISIGEYRLRFNDQLRVVHDVFGHALYGNGFGPRGELLATQVHMEMLEPRARSALFTETAAQTCWFYFGSNTNVPVPERPFPSQKAVLLPARVRVL